VTLLGLSTLACRAPAGSKEAPGGASALALKHSRRATRALLANDLPLARRELEVALKEGPAHAPALLLRACVALEAGDVREVEDALARLRTVSPERAEPKLLERLGAHRQREGTGWRQAFLSAWMELGRPSFRDSPLLLEPAPDEADTTPDAWRQASSEPVRLALALSASPLTEEQARWLLARVPHLDDAAFVIAADNLLRDRSEPAVRPEAGPVLRAKLGQLVQAHPRSMQLHLLDFLADTHPDAALDAKALEALEAISALPDWREHVFAHTFRETRRQLESVGLPHAAGRAFGVATLSVTDRGSHLLRKRAEATRSQLLPGARHRLGRILWNVGARMAEENTLVERMVGLQFMVKGARDMQDDAGRARVEAQVEEAHAILSAEHGAGLGRWPLPSLQAEVLEAHVEDEWAHLRAFAGPTP
jgi:hypothetical protein